MKNTTLVLQKISNNPDKDTEKTLIIPACNDAMHPKIKQGEFMFMEKVTNKSMIHEGMIYLIITNDYKIVRYIKKHENPDNLILQTESKNYDDVVIQWGQISEMYLYKGKYSQSIN